jgi:hypothetical protein
MKTNSYFWFALLAAALAWTGVESYRYSVAKKQLAQSEQRVITVNAKYAQLQAAQTQIAVTPPADSE